ncbi:MAG: radical SAM protein [Candidatus Bipolaricaulota bacterium]
MKLSGLHLLLTYECNMECEHCFVWGSPWNSGTMTLEDVRNILRQARELDTVKWIYFEGGEPFLYYPLLLRAIEDAAAMGFKVGVVTNAYWATTLADAFLWLRPLAGKVGDLSLSSDLFHSDELLSQRAQAASTAATELGIRTEIITICGQEDSATGESSVMHRGRAAEKLVDGCPRKDWTEFAECPHEDLREPGRVHIDPLGHVHICQGLSLGNLFRTELATICRRYEPGAHPIIGPLLEGGPAEILRRYDLPSTERYVDACHLCYMVRAELRPRFPEILSPDQMYGVPPS